MSNNSEEQRKPPANEQSRGAKSEENPNKVIYVEKKGGLSKLEKGGIWASIAISAITLFLVGYNIEAFTATVKSAEYSDSTFKEIKKEFEILNRPILQIGDIAVGNFEPGKKPVVVYKLENHGTFAAKTLVRKFKLGYVKNMNERPVSPSWEKIEIPIYISKEIPFTENMFMSDTLEREYYEAIYKGELIIMAVGEFEYINEASNKSCVFEFAIKIYPPPSKDFQVYVANNREK